MSNDAKAGKGCESKMARAWFINSISDFVFHYASVCETQIWEFRQVPAVPRGSLRAVQPDAVCPNWAPSYLGGALQGGARCGGGLQTVGLPPRSPSRIRLGPTMPRRGGWPHGRLNFD